MNHLIPPSPPHTGGSAQRRPRFRPLLVLAVALLGVGVVVATLLEPLLGMLGLIPFGLLLAFSAGSGEAGSIGLTRRNLWVSAAMVVSTGAIWVWHPHLPEWVLVAMAGTLMALPVALQESPTGSASERTVVVPRRSLILAIMGLVSFAFVYRDGGVWLFGLAAICLVIPVVLVTSRMVAAHRRGIEWGLLVGPLRAEMRPHLVQALNIWVCCALLAGIVAAGGTHFARIFFSLDETQFGILIGTFAVGLTLLALLALVPRRRVFLDANVTVALLSGFLAFHLVGISVPPRDPVVLDLPLTGEWFVQNGGRSVLLNGHPRNESNGVDFQLMGANGRTHTGGADSPLSDYATFGSQVLAPSDGRIVEVTEGFIDNPPGTNGDYANHLLIDIGAGRYVSMAHVQQGSVTVRVGDDVRRGQVIAAVGNNGHSSAPHLHVQVQDTTDPSSAPRTYPILFRNVTVTRGGAWPWGDSRELRTGDLVQASGR